MNQPESSPQPTPQPGPRPGPPGVSQSVKLHDHSETLESLRELPLSEHLEVFSNIHDELTSTLHKAER